MCVPVPPSPSIAGYGGGQIYVQVPQRLPDDDEAIVAMLLELLN